MKIGLIDSHAHLSQPDFDPDRKAVIARAKSQGLKLIISIGTDQKEFLPECSIANENPGYVYLAIGYHPHIARHINDKDYEALEDLIRKTKGVIALGETGLDFYYKHSDPISQDRVFRHQLRLAEKLSIPVIIHCRDAYPKVIEILKQEKVSPERVLIHCFSGVKEQAEELTKWGATLSFAGPVTYPKATNLHDAVKCTPTDRLLVETDAPYLAPQHFRGKRNEPAYIIETYRKIAQIKGIHIDELCEKVAQTFSRFFGLQIE